jgi:predicted nucleotidyltransferase
MNPYDIYRFAEISAVYLVSSLTQTELKRVNNVLIYGSAARFSATEDSDIDIFFDVSGPKRFQLALRSKLNKSADQFQMTNAALEFKSKGIFNELSIKVGKLEEWKDLSQSMASHAIIVFGKYTGKPHGLGAYTILSWELPGKSKGALLNKIYGYKASGKHYPGLLEKNGGVKLGRAVIMVPSQRRDAFIDAIEKYKVNYSRCDIWK